MLRINIVDYSNYDQEYMNIFLYLDNGNREYMKDLCISLHDLSFPTQSIFEIRCSAHIFEELPTAITSAFLVSCKTWLAVDGGSFLNIDIYHIEQQNFVIELLQACGYHIRSNIKKTNGVTTINAVTNQYSFCLEDYWRSIIARTSDITTTSQMMEEWHHTYQMYYNRWRAKGVGKLPPEMGPESGTTTEMSNNSVIIVYLWGGLGNQLYLYAFAKSLAEIWQTEVKLDTSWFGLQKSGITPRTYRLNHFSITAHEMEKSDLTAVLIEDMTRGPWSDRYDYRQRPLLQEQFPRGFDPLVLLSPPPLYISGYWQSYKYFERIRSILLKEFIISTAPSAITREISKLIVETNSVSVHIRRGDYVIHGQVLLLPIAYYYQAVAKIGELIDKPHFYIFSDDPKWVKENFAIEYATTVVDCNNEENDYDDLRLMSLCKHHILANSSFSWWAAWLNHSNEKIVIVPNSYGNCNTDVYPPDWIVI